MVKLTSKKIKLRIVNKSDLKAVHELLVLPETDRFNTLGLPENIGVINKLLNTWIKESNKKPITNYTLVIENKLNDNFMGLFGLTIGREVYKSAEVCYKIYPDFWGNGIATEALHCIRFLF